MNIGAFAQSSLPLYKNPLLSVDERVKDLLSRMTLEEKVGQLLSPLGWEMYEIKDDEVYPSEKFKKLIKEKNAGMLWATYRADPWTRKTLENGLRPELAAKAGNALQKYAIENTRLGIPVFLAEEAPHGHMAIGTTVFPTSIGQASTWNPELIEEIGYMVGKEMQEFHVDLWLAPALNIHRNPLCGRNFEYYSEDPLIAGKCAAAMTLGVQKDGKGGTTIKHFAANNLEDNRMFSNNHMSERALREIYLKGFEIAVKDAQPMSIMTSYNLINGVHAANCYDTCTKAARDEWGFAGAIMTDWTTTNVQIQGECTAAGCMRAGNDMVMPGLPEDHENIKKELADGTLTMAELKRCIYNTVNIVLQSNMYEGAVSYLDQFDDLDTYLVVK